MAREGTSAKRDEATKKQVKAKAKSVRLTDMNKHVIT